MRSADRGWPARPFRKLHAPRPRSRRRSRGARLLVAVLLKGRADEGVDRRIVVETRRRIRIPMWAVVEAADRLAANAQIVWLVDCVTAVIDAEMAARHDADAAILAVAAREGDPGCHLLMRRQPEIGGVLMPGDEASVFPVFRPERRGEEQDVGTDEILDRVENTLVAGDRHERGEAKMGLEAQQFPEAVMAALGLF